MGKHICVKELPYSERPYEKFLSQGCEALSDAELLAIVIKNGTKDKTVLEIAQELLSIRQKNLLNLYELSYDELLAVKGIGQVKAIQLKAIAELSKRIVKTNRGYQIRLNNPASIADYFMEEMRHSSKEILVCAFFDAKACFLGEARISVGSTSYAYVSPKDIFHEALIRNASMLVLLHNHPSGDPTPSKDDIAITNRMRECANLMDFVFADHIIIGDNHYFSFHEQHL